MTATRYLYLARHAEATPDETGLTDAGRRQAELLGRRLRDGGRQVHAVRHGPLARAAETARIVGAILGVEPQVTEAAGDYVPYRDDLPAAYQRFVGQFGDDGRGPRLAAEAIERFTGPVPGDDDHHELVVTHAFTIGWLLRHALGAPEWRWLTVNQGNAALTVIRYAPGRAPSVLVHNDTRHLPDELRWTGFPDALQV
ncbi:histidine phosphatase family protein [Jiangella rhizosphaerae]|uniref:Histidine phosphatase family protein n=1 Tax=Jiangella rhizosphaerae TaxID=2293569 RepID=A0A418KQE1_9ACTN|nr:histidine phosphatase family protein [Jiangella rhizosphaerae]RIQ22058.1 histidine phosphatase family protein [Jiangella rhizosphaerae]